MDTPFLSVAVLLPVAGIIAAILAIVVVSKTLGRRSRRARGERATRGVVESPRPDQGPTRESAKQGAERPARDGDA